MIERFLKALSRDKRLIITWTRYNIEANYLDTKLGIIWLVLQPLLMTIMYSLVFSLVLNRSPRGGVPFVNFFLSGMVLWLSFSGSIIRSTTLVAGKANLMGQIQFPRYVIVLVLFLEKMVDVAVGITILFFLNLFYGYYPNTAYFYIPLVLLTFFSLELGGMFILATLGLFIRDIPQIINLLLRLLLYFSAIIFPADMLPERVAAILSYNPIFFLVESFRNIIFYAEVPNLMGLIAWFLVNFLVLIGGVYFFQRKSGVFADYK